MEQFKFLLQTFLSQSRSCSSTNFSWKAQKYEGMLSNYPSVLIPFEVFNLYMNICFFKSHGQGFESLQSEGLLSRRMSLKEVSSAFVKHFLKLEERVQSGSTSCNNRSTSRYKPIPAGTRVTLRYPFHLLS